MYEYPHANEIYKVTILRNFEKPKVTAPIYQHLWAHKFVSHNTKFVKYKQIECDEVVPRSQNQSYRAYH